MVLAGVFAMMIAGRPAAAADTGPCSDPALQSASVQSTLQVKIRGVDWPSMTSVMQITVPESWRGTSDLFGDASQQGSALACFMPINNYDYQAAPPDITVQAATKTRHAQVNVTNVITMADGPDAPPIWREGPWTVTKEAGGYQVAFAPQQPSAAAQYGSWTVTLCAPDLNIVHPAPEPATDSGQGKLTWSFLAAKPPAKPPAKTTAARQPKKPAPRPLPRVSVALTSPWQVHMNLAADPWPMRWLSDASWALNDGVLFDVVVLVLSLRLLRRRSGKPEQRRLPAAVISLSCVSIIAYGYYLLDNYIWHTAYGEAGWKLENIILLYIAAWFFFSGLGKLPGWLWVTIGSTLPIITALILSLDLSRAPMYSYDSYSRPPKGFGISDLLVLLIPLLLALTLAGVGAVLWISRLWPFGKREPDGLLRQLNDTWLARNGRVVVLRVVVLMVAGLFVSALILGQSAASAYYYWQHSDLWIRGPGVFTWMAADMISDAHWWIGDGLQWPLSYAILAGLFAVLRAMRADARGAFFGRYPSDRADLTLMAAITACIFIGTWGYYAGFSIPIPSIVAFVLLIVWGLTRKLSETESRAAVEGRPDLGPEANGSLLGRFQNDLLTASDQSFKSRAKRKGLKRAAARAGTAGNIALQEVIPLKSLATAGTGAGTQDGEPPQLKLPCEMDPGVTALALGPGSTWWDNGVAAVRRGIYLTIVPIGFDLYIMWNSGDLSQVNFPFGLQDAIGYAAGNVIGWMAGLFMFGVLLSYFRGVRTPVKGLVFGLIGFAAFAADAGIRHAVGLAPYPTFMVDGLLAIALFATVGLLLDISTLQKHNDQGAIGSIYRLGSVRVGVTYATTLIIVGVSLWQAVYLTGQSAQQRATNLSNAAQTISNVGGSGKS